MNYTNSSATEQDKLWYVSNSKAEWGKHSNLYNNQLINILEDSRLIAADRWVIESLGAFNTTHIVPILYDHSTTTRKLDTDLIDYMQTNTIPPSLKTIFKFIKKIPAIENDIENLRNTFIGKPHEKNIQITRILENYRSLYRQRFNKGWLYIPKARPNGKRTDKDRTSGEYTIMANIITLLLLLQENNTIH